MSCEYVVDGRILFVYFVSNRFHKCSRQHISNGVYLLRRHIFKREYMRVVPRWLFVCRKHGHTVFGKQLLDWWFVRLYFMPNRLYEHSRQFLVHLLEWNVHEWRRMHNVSCRIVVLGEHRNYVSNQHLLCQWCIFLCVVSSRIHECTRKYFTSSLYLLQWQLHEQRCVYNVPCWFDVSKWRGSNVSSRHLFC
jgi:hypothetical protein